MFCIQFVITQAVLGTGRESLPFRINGVDGIFRIIYVPSNRNRGASKRRKLEKNVYKFTSGGLAAT